MTRMVDTGINGVVAFPDHRDTIGCAILPQFKKAFFENAMVEPRQPEVTPEMREAVAARQAKLQAELSADIIGG